MEKTMDRNFYKNITGYFDFGWLYGLAVNLAGSRAGFVEVGSWLGKSAAFMCEEISASDKVISFNAVDPWYDYGGYKDTYNLFMKNLDAHGLSGFVEPVQKESYDASQLFGADVLDMVFIDGDHTYEGVKKDIGAWLSKVKHYGILAGHDYNWEGVKEAVNEAFGDDFIVIGIVWMYAKDKLIRSFLESLKLLVNGDHNAASVKLQEIIEITVDSKYEQMKNLALLISCCIDTIFGGSSVESEIVVNGKRESVENYLYENRGVCWLFELGVLALCRKNIYHFSEDLFPFLVKNCVYNDKLHELHFYHGRYKEQKGIKGCEEDFNLCIEILKTFEARENRDTYILASALKRIGNGEDALKYFKEITDGEFDQYYSLASMFHSGEILYDRGTFDKASIFFRKVLDDNPAHNKASEYLKKIKNNSAG